MHAQLYWHSFKAKHHWEQDIADHFLVLLSQSNSIVYTTWLYAVFPLCIKLKKSLLNGPLKMEIQGSKCYVFLCKLSKRDEFLHVRGPAISKVGFSLTEELTNNLGIKQANMTLVSLYATSHKHERTHACTHTCSLYLPSEDDYSILGRESRWPVNCYLGLSSLAKTWVPGKVPFLWKVLSQEQWKVGASKVLLFWWWVPQIFLCLASSPGCLKVQLHVHEKVWDWEGLLAIPSHC